ncbi:hypothetical protein DWB84_16400 [Saccharophagus sp. K07]|nr:hypothetical protein [Saccharophagus sp. K07]
MKLYSAIGYWLTATFLLLGCFCAQAECTVAPATLDNPVNFGTVPSRDVPLGSISPNGGAPATYFYADCTVLLTIGLLSAAGWIEYEVLEPLELINGESTISYVIASTADYTPVITQPGGTIGGVGGLDLLSLTLLANTQQMHIPLYIKTISTGIWPTAGTYTGIQKLSVRGEICELLSILNICLLTSTFSRVVDMPLVLEVSKSCEFSSVASQVDMGQMSFLEDAETATLNATVRCTNQEDYLLYADNGDHYSGGFRNMESTTGTKIAYEIFHHGSPSEPLTAANPMSREGTGGFEAVSLPVRVVPGQETPVSGVYKDNIRLILEY